MYYPIYKYVPEGWMDISEYKRTDSCFWILVAKNVNESGYKWNNFYDIKKVIKKLETEYEDSRPIPLELLYEEAINMTEEEKAHFFKSLLMMRICDPMDMTENIRNIYGEIINKIQHDAEQKEKFFVHITGNAVTNVRVRDESGELIDINKAYERGTIIYIDGKLPLNNEQYKYSNLVCKLNGKEVEQHSTIILSDNINIDISCSKEVNMCRIAISQGIGTKGLTVKSGDTIYKSGDMVQCGTILSIDCSLMPSDDKNYYTNLIVKCGTNEINAGSTYKVTNDVIISSSAKIIPKNCTVTIVNSEGGTISVFANEKTYTSTFTVPYNTSFTVSQNVEAGYTPGVLNITEGKVTSDMVIRYSKIPTIEQYLVTVIGNASKNVKIVDSFGVRVNPNTKHKKGIVLYINGELPEDTDAYSYKDLKIKCNGVEMPCDKTIQITLNEDTVIEASALINVNSYEVTITQSKHQTIIVTANGVPYISTFTAPYGTHYTVTIEAEERYESGELNILSGVLTDDIEINASAAIIIRPAIDGYLTFSASYKFYLSLYPGSSKKIWDGIIEYSTDTKTWSEWNGKSIYSQEDNSEYKLYLRGTGNTVITGNSNNNISVVSYSNQLKNCVSCTGNIETLLDYQTVLDGEHPVMAERCFYELFKNSDLIEAPELPALELSKECYRGMFRGTLLSKTPELPAMTLVNNCYYSMFNDCKHLTELSKLPATTLAEYCYAYMFYGCTSLTETPELPATKLADWCYDSMFEDCTSLAKAPELPATKLADWCYDSMFEDCTSLAKAPELPATTLAEHCYRRMFYGCTSLVQAPKILPAETISTNSCYEMFYNCKSLIKAPAIKTCSIIGTSAIYSMFGSCVLLKEIPAFTLKNSYAYCLAYAFYGCTSLKFSETQTEECPNEYRISAEKTSDTYMSLASMFSGTSGTFTGTPKWNTTYYTNAIIIQKEG